VKFSSSETDIGLGLGLGELRAVMETWDFLPGAHHFDLLVSSMSSQPDLRSRVCGRGRGVLSDRGPETILDASWVTLELL
jgi:hypothetical protein